MLINRNAPAVIYDADRIVGVDNNLYIPAEARKNLINGVVDDFIDKMVKPNLVRGSNIHRGSFPYAFKTAKNLYVLGGVLSDFFIHLFPTFTFISFMNFLPGSFLLSNFTISSEFISMSFFTIDEPV